VLQKGVLSSSSSPIDRTERMIGPGEKSFKIILALNETLRITSRRENRSVLVT